MEGFSSILRGYRRKIDICISCCRRISSLRPKYTFSQTSQFRNLIVPTQPKRALQTERQDATHGASHISQAYPLKGYYSDILTQPNNISNPSHQQKNQDTPAPPSRDISELSPSEKMGIVFGTRLAGPGYTSRYNPSTPPDSTWQTINGVPIPPRPSEPDNCCMSGCVHCVWDDYRDDVEEWALRVRDAKSRQPRTSTASKEKADSRQLPRREVASASISMDDDGGGSTSNWSNETLLTDSGDLFEGIPVGIKEFMKTEKKLREKKRSQREAA